MSVLLRALKIEAAGDMVSASKKAFRLHEL